MRTKVFIGVVTLALAFPQAFQAAEKAPTVEAILANYVAAIGGKAAVEKIKTRACKGRIEIATMNLASDWELRAKAPNKQLSKWELTGSGTMLDGFDGTTAWAKNPFDGLRLKQGDELAKMKREADFTRELKMKQLYPDLAYKSTETLDGEEVQVLEAKPSGSSKERFSFSSKTGLLVRQESEFEGQQGKVRVNARMSDFRVVDGFRYPHMLKCGVEIGDQKFEFSIKLAEIKHNVPIEDAVFAKPAS